MAAYCVIKGSEYIVEERPLVDGNTAPRYKDALNELERASPGTKVAFLFGFLDRAQGAHFAHADLQAASPVPCQTCGIPTTSRHSEAEPICAFCRTRGRLLQLVAAP